VVSSNKPSPVRVADRSRSLVTPRGPDRGRVVGDLAGGGGATSVASSAVCCCAGGWCPPTNPPPSIRESS